MRKLALTALLLSACGADSGGDKKSSQDAAFPSWAVADTQDLPACTPALEGALVYVKAAQGLQYCEAEKWVNTDLGRPTIAANGIFVSRTVCSLLASENDQNVIVAWERWDTNTDEVWFAAQVGDQPIFQKWNAGETVKVPADGGQWIVTTRGDKLGTFVYSHDSKEVETYNVDPEKNCAVEDFKTGTIKEPGQ